MVKSSGLVGGHVSVAGGICLGIERAVNIGSNCMQFFAGSPRMWKRELFVKDDVTAFHRLVERHNIRRVFIHALYLVNLASDKKEIIAKSMNSLLIDLHNSERIHAEGVIIHIGSHQGRGFDEVKEVLADRIAELLKSTDTAVLILENSAGQKGKIGSLDELSWLVRRLDHPRVKVCIDTAHLFAAGDAFMTVAEADFLVKRIEELGLLRKICCIHLNDSQSEFNSKRDVHANLGEGKIGLDALKNLVARPELISLPFILEVPGDPHSKQKGPDATNISCAWRMLK